MWNGVWKSLNIIEGLLAVYEARFIGFDFNKTLELHSSRRRVCSIHVAENMNYSSHRNRLLRLFCLLSRARASIVSQRDSGEPSKHWNRDLRVLILQFQLNVNFNFLFPIVGAAGCCCHHVVDAAWWIKAEYNLITIATWVGGYAEDHHQFQVLLQYWIIRKDAAASTIAEKQQKERITAEEKDRLQLHELHDNDDDDCQLRHKREITTKATTAAVESNIAAVTVVVYTYKKEVLLNKKWVCKRRKKLIQLQIMENCNCHSFWAPTGASWSCRNGKGNLNFLFDAFIAIVVSMIM